MKNILRIINLIKVVAPEAFLWLNLYQKDTDPALSLPIILSLSMMVLAKASSSNCSATYHCIKLWVVKSFSSKQSPTILFMLSVTFNSCSSKDSKHGSTI